MTPEQQAVIDAAVAWQKARTEGIYGAGPRVVLDYNRACMALDAAVERMQAVRHG